MQLSIKTILKSNQSDFSSFTAVIMEPDVDLHGDIASVDAIKKAAHDYLKNQEMKSKLQHQKDTEDIALVESYILEDDKTFNEISVKKGAWIGKFQVNNAELKEKIKQGDYLGVSIGAKAVVEDINKSLANPYKDNPKRKLSEININEISLVDYPANNKTILSLNKSAENKQEGDIMTLEEIMKHLKNSSELMKEVKKELMDKVEHPQTEEDIKKSLDPKVLEILKAKEDRLAVLEKAHEENIRKEFLVKVEEIKKYAKAEDNLTEALITISKSHPKEYACIEKTLFDSIDTIKKIDLTKSTGGDNPNDILIQSSEQSVEEIAKSLMNKDRSLTKEQAVAKVYTDKLYQKGA